MKISSAESGKTALFTQILRDFPAVNLVVIETKAEEIPM